MRRCTCSTRALESFVQDFAGLHIRQQRAQRFFQHYRTFGTRPPVRQLETTTTPSVDDGFISFEADISQQNERIVKSRGNASEAREEVVEAEESPVSKDEEWHAEIEITSPDAQAERVEETTVDSISLGSLHSGPEQHERTSAAHVPMLNLPAISQNIPDPSRPAKEKVAEPRKKYNPSGATKGAKPVLTKGRQLRKLRRLQEGKYRQAAAQKELEESREEDYEFDDDDVGGVLKKIDALEGPSVSKSKEASSIEPKKSKVTASTSTETFKAGKGKDVKAKGQKGGDKKTAASKETNPKPAWKDLRDRWMIEKDALKKKFGDEGWQPNKRLSPDTLDGIRALHASDPATYSTATLAEHFLITPEAIRRILKSKWRPSSEEIEKRNDRWEKRGLKKWEEMAAQGIKPPKKWREMGAANPKLERKREKDEGSGHDRLRKKQSKWEDMMSQAERLPMEGGFADRIL